ncbi:TrmO family methyltransferase [Micromonospora sp. NPDC023966]|uniref:TrmO family methyltransferase domain-containing protein n=1 Tax=Micromonospora sp. NPDC023966 TaxID=3154699 RepID=UPI0033CC34BA
MRSRSRADLPEVGVSADRGPHRPNRTGYTICEVVSASRAGTAGTRTGAVDGTPVLGINP